MKHLRQLPTHTESQHVETAVGRKMMLSSPVARVLGEASLALTGTRPSTSPEEPLLFCSWLHGYCGPFRSYFLSSSALVCQIGNKPTSAKTMPNTCIQWTNQEEGAARTHAARTATCGLDLLRTPSIPTMTAHESSH